MPDRPKPKHHTPVEARISNRDRLIDLSAVLVLIPVLLPLLVVFSPSLFLESDPRSAGEVASTAISFGPTGLMWLASAGIVIAAWVMGTTVWAGGRVRWWSCLFIAAGIVPCIGHMPGHFISRLHGGAWIAAASLGLAAAHLAQFDRAKRLIVAALIAITLPLFIQSTWYVYVEHPATVQSFTDNLEQGLALRGLTPDTPQAAKYLTRLEGNDAIGAVGMSNVFGSLVAAISVIALASVIAGRRRRVRPLQLSAMIGLLLLGLWTLKLTQSKGAVLALGATIGLGLCALGFTKINPKLKRVMPVFCVLLVLAGSAAVFFRGAAGPPKDHHGERSLLFRYHYWQGASKLWLDEPTQSWQGVGPGLFKSQYDAARNPISPEVVSSTHNVFVDYTVMLGVGGVMWSLLLLAWLWQAGRSLGTDTNSRPDESRAPPANYLLRLFGPLAAVLFLTQYAVQFPGLYAETAILWLIGALGFVGLTTYVAYPIVSKAPGWTASGLSLAAVLLLLHAQIEMTFFWSTAAAFVWVTLGLASGRKVESITPRKAQLGPLRYLPAGVLLALGITFIFVFAEPTARHQTHLRQAEHALRQSNDHEYAIAELDRASRVIGNDPTTTRWRVGLRQEIAAALMFYDRPKDAQAFIEAAMGVIDEAERAGLSALASSRQRGQLAMSAYQITDSRDWLHRAEQAYALAVERSPNGLNDHVRLADARWQLNNFDAAITTYRQALQISDNYYLDPDTQLTEEDHKRIERRISKEAVSP